MRHKKERRGALIAALVMAVALIGCERTTISDITRHPLKHEGDEVTIAGKVTQSGGDFKKGTFEVDDGTGRLWVISNQPDLPEQGSLVAVTGLVVAGASMGLNSMATVLQETSRHVGHS